MKTASQPRETDILFMHADDEATIRYEYSAIELREGLLFHILYAGRVLIPLPFILANPAFNDLFRAGGAISERSDMYRLVNSGDIVPVLYHGGYSCITDYARDALDRGIIIHCPDNEFLERAELLDEFSYAVPSGVGSHVSYKEVLLSLIARENLQGEYFGKRYLKAGKQIAEQIAAELASSDQLFRSDVYRVAERLRSARSQIAVKQIADAAYYAAIADEFGANPAVPGQSLAAMISHYSGTAGPLLFSPGQESVIGAPVPDLSNLSIATVVEDLRSTSLHKRWLKALRRGIKEGQIDLAGEEMQSTMGHWTQFLFDYLQKSGPRQREAVLRRERRFSVVSRVIQAGEIAVIAAGIVDSAAGLVQGRAPITEVTLFGLLAVADVALRALQRRSEAKRPVYGSAVPITRTFTARGQRYG